MDTLREVIIKAAETITRREFPMKHNELESPIRELLNTFAGQLADEVLNSSEVDRLQSDTIDASLEELPTVAKNVNRFLGGQ